METSYLPSTNIIVVEREVALRYSGSMLLPNWLLSAFLVASPLAAVADEVKVQAEDPDLLAVPVAAELLRKLPQLPMKHPADPADPTYVFPPSRCPWQSIQSNGCSHGTTYNCCYCALCKAPEAA